MESTFLHLLKIYQPLTSYVKGKLLIKLYHIQAGFLAGSRVRLL